MNKKLLFILAFLITVNFIQAQSYIAVKKFHPRVLLDSSIIIKLQSRAAANTTEWQQLQTRISAISSLNSTQIMNTVYEGQQYAIMKALSFYASGNTQHRDSAVSIFKEYFIKHTKDSSMYYDSGFESRSTLAETAMLYDWLYTYLSEPFRSNVRTRLIYWGNWIRTKPNIYGIWGSPYYFEGNNYTMGHFAGLTHLGFAIHSEDSVNAKKFIKTSDSIRPYLMNFANTRLKNGDANEGWGYGAGYAINYLKALAIFKTGSKNNIDHFVNTTYDEDAIKFLPYATLPNLTHMLPEGDWARESTGELWEYHRLVADLISSYSNDATSRQVALFYANETVPFNSFAVTAYRWFPFLFSNKEITPLDYRTQPVYQTNYLYTDTSGTDQFIRRTGWNANSQWVSYRAGARYGDHAHNGSGHFSVYDHGWLLVDKNIFTSSGIEGMDSMHNCIHVQKMNNFEMYAINDYINAEHSTNVRRDLNNEYSYLWSNSAPIYLKRGTVTFNNVNENQRQFFYIPGINKIAVYDIVKTTNSTYKKWFGFSFYGNPTLSNDSSYSFYSNSQKTAYVHTAYPLNKNVVKFGKSIRVNNNVNQAKDYFMHLVSTAPNAASPLNVVSLNKDNGRVVVSDFYGSYHQDAVKDYAILFASDNTAFNYDSLVYEIPFSNKPIHSYIIGLDLSFNYYVSSSLANNGDIRIRVNKQNHTASTMRQSTAGGVLSFDLLDYVGIKEINKVISDYHIYYNSLSETILIENQATVNNSKVSLIAIDGKEIISSVSFTSRSLTLSTNNIAKGIYIVKITSDNNVISTQKLIIY
ncbi:MAG: T9SS type A sorting domain-containing protein [Bacteroidia bacterium]|nr:T9SS type A sorting domain-containing protein [Bacteroidia bacterium]